MSEIREHLSAPLGLDRRGRGLSRRREHLGQIIRVRLARPAFLIRSGGVVPPLTLSGCRLTVPPTVRLPLSAPRSERMLNHDDPSDPGFTAHS